MYIWCFFIMFVIYLCSFLSLFGLFLQVKDTINAATVVHPASALVQRSMRADT